ncbi:double homeobox protein B-like isoform X2 [Dasypus novemcinctus]|uniref:double homeobox protein B-like isoform X2 n=1 Tax=Dasypus novemcinctus TaxID=9361 RepID=UPI00062A58A1|nr:double homeobox protein B-like isoform X3 [Dasypus novemcinctus]
MLGSCFKNIIPGSMARKSDTLQREAPRRRTILNQRQKDTLEAWFKGNPYPSISTREQLAKEIGIPESRIQVWFQNHRARQLKAQRPKSGYFLEEDQTHVQDQPLLRTQGAGHRRNRIHMTRSQIRILVQAFEKNRFPGIATREELAKETGIPESRIQIWFQNRRSRHQRQSTRRPVNSLGDTANLTEELTVQQHQNDHSILPTRYHNFLPSSSFSIKQNSCLLFCTSFIPWDPFGGCVSQASSVLMVQPTQTVQAVENPHSPLTLMNHVPIVLPPGRGFLDTQTSFRPQHQEKCQDHNEHAGLGVLQSKNFLQHKPDNKKQLKDLGQQDITFLVQWWDEWCQALIAEWEPPEGTLGHARPTEIDLQRHLAQSAEEAFSLPMAPAITRNVKPLNQHLPTTDLQ